MIVYDSNKIFYPNKCYIDIDFESIKQCIMKIPGEKEDYGSYVMIKHTTHFITVNRLGKIKVFYDESIDNCAKETVKTVTEIFKNHGYDI